MLLKIVAAFAVACATAVSAVAQQQPTLGDKYYRNAGYARHFRAAPPAQYNAATSTGQPGAAAIGPSGVYNGTYGTSYNSIYGAAPSGTLSGTLGGAFGAVPPAGR